MNRPVSATQVIACLQVFREGDHLHSDMFDRPVIQRRDEEGLVTLGTLPLVKLYGDGDGDHTLKPLQDAAKRIVRVRKRPIEVVRFTVREHCEWIEP